MVFCTVAMREISIHALREEGDDGRHRCGRAKHISIHALREEGDARPVRKPIGQAYFYPRPPRGGRHHGEKQGQNRKQISIHALREEGDVYAPFRLVGVDGISIHALREEGD